jgi:hypothetical protein
MAAVTKNRNDFSCQFLGEGPIVRRPICLLLLVSFSGLVSFLVIVVPSLWKSSGCQLVGKKKNRKLGWYIHVYMHV